MDQTKRSNSPFKNIIVLTDFEDGAWNAIRFACHHLYTPGATIHLVQTFQKPSMGQSLVRNMVPILEKMVLSNLRNLKNRIESNYSIPTDAVQYRSFQGELEQFLGMECKGVKDCCLVAGLSHSFEMRSNSRLLKRIENIQHPLFILRDKFVQTNTSYIHFATDLSYKPAPDLLETIRQLHMGINSDLQLRLTSYNKPASHWGGIRQYLLNQLSGIRFTIEYKEILSIKEWVHRSLQFTNDNLIVVAPNHNPAIRSGLKLSWSSKVQSKLKQWISS